MVIFSQNNDVAVAVAAVVTETVVASVLLLLSLSSSLLPLLLSLLSSEGGKSSLSSVVPSAIKGSLVNTKAGRASQLHCLIWTDRPPTHGEQMRGERERLYMRPRGSTHTRTQKSQNVAGGANKRQKWIM